MDETTALATNGECWWIGPLAGICSVFFAIMTDNQCWVASNDTVKYCLFCVQHNVSYFCPMRSPVSIPDLSYFCPMRSPVSIPSQRIHSSQDRNRNGSPPRSFPVLQNLLFRCKDFSRYIGRFCNIWIRCLRSTNSALSLRENSAPSGWTEVEPQSPYFPSRGLLKAWVVGEQIGHTSSIFASFVAL